MFLNISKDYARKIAKTGDVDRLRNYFLKLEESDPHHVYQATVSALNSACEYSQLEIIRYILTDEHMNSLNTNYMSNNEYESFRHACKTDDVEIVRYLTTSPELKEHADIYYDGTALITALLYKCHDVVSYFLYDMRMEMSPGILKRLADEDKSLDPRHKYTELIKRRDTYFKLQDEIAEKDIVVVQSYIL